jgi:hypothetical protein
VDGDRLAVECTIENNGEAAAKALRVEMRDIHPDGTTNRFFSSYAGDLPAGRDRIGVAHLDQALRGPHTIRVTVIWYDEDGHEMRRNHEMSKEVRPAAGNIVYLGYPATTLDESVAGDWGHRTSKYLLEPAWWAYYQKSANLTYTAVVAGFATGGNSWARVDSESFTFRESTKLKFADMHQTTARMEGGFKGKMSRFRGIAGWSSARAEIDMYLLVEKDGSWEEVTSHEIFDEQNTDGSADYGIGIGGTSNPYKDGFSATVWRNTVEPGKRYRVRLRLKTSASAAGNEGGMSNFHDYDYGAWWNTVSINTW